MNWSKFIVFMKLDDPYVWPALVGKVKERLQSFNCDQLLVICVNIAHSLSSEATGFFSLCSAHFSGKLDQDYNPSSVDTLLKEEDLPKLLTTFGEYRMLDRILAEGIADYVKDNMMFIKLENLSDICVLYSKYCDKTQIDAFQQQNLERILSNVPFCTDEVYFRFLWTFCRDRRLPENDRRTFVKTFEDNHVQFNNKYFVQSMVLLAKDNTKKQNMTLYNTVGKRYDVK